MLTLSAYLWLAAPPPEPAPPEPTLTQEDRAYHRERTTLGIAGMTTLTGWAVANIAGGLAGNFTTSEGPLRYFHQGNAAWNSVNLVLGVIGLVGQTRERRRPVPLAVGRGSARKAQLAFLVNGALDVLYIGAGAASWQLAAGRSDRFVGYGQALVLQGAFLFVFDFAMAWAHERQIQRGPRRAPVLLPSATAGPTGLSLGVAGRF